MRRHVARACVCVCVCLCVVCVMQPAWADVAAVALAHHMWEPGQVSKWSRFDEVGVIWHKSPQCLAGPRDRSPNGFAAVVVLCMCPQIFATSGVPRRIRLLSLVLVEACTRLSCMCVCAVCIVSNRLVLRGAGLSGTTDGRDAMTFTMRCLVILSPVRPAGILQCL